LKIRFTPSAEAELLSALRFIRQDNRAAAGGLLERVFKRLRRLESFPDSGRRIPEFPDLPHREIIINSFRFFYKVESRTVWIVAVWHGAQAPSRPAVD
jgi:toxin ParE1/3/4